MKGKLKTTAPNVIPLIPNEVQSGLDKFAQSHDLSDFLALIEAVAKTPVECTLVWETWNRFKGKIQTKRPVNAILETVARLSFPQTQNIPISNQEADNRSRSDLAKVIEDCFKELKKQEEYFEIRLTDQNDPYRFFPVAWPVEKSISDNVAFGKDDPAKVISRYLSAFYEHPLNGSGSIKLIEVRQACLPSFLKETLLPWGFTHERDKFMGQGSGEGLRRSGQLDEIESFLPHLFDLLEGKIDLDEPATFPQGFTVHGFARVLPHLPQALFERMASIVGSCYFCGEVYDISIEQGYPELLDVLLSLPLDGPFRSQDEFEVEVPNNSFLREIMGPYPCIDDLPYLPIRMLRDLTDTFNDYEFCPIDQMGHGRFCELYDLLIRRIARIRKQRYGGRSPLGYKQAGIVGHWIWLLSESCGSKKRHDITYLLSTSSGYSFGGVSFSGELTKLEPEDAKWRAQLYLQIIENLHEEGWHEFANASLAFYLFSQPIYTKDHQLHADWSQLSRLIRAGMELPGDHLVKRALHLAHELISLWDGFDKLDALCLASWLPHDGQHQKSTLSVSDFAEMMFDHKQTESELKEYLGNETWMKLSPQGKRQLIDADAEWSALHRQLGKGRHDWGSPATAYFKVIEGELLQRMKGIYTSQLYADHHHRTKGRPPGRHAEIGAMLHLLKDFENLDEPLRRKITDSGIRIQEDEDLLNKLLKLVQERNNGGAHAGEFSAKRFVAFRQALFGDGTLKRFVELL